jgi:hypothetical protein
MKYPSRDTHNLLTDVRCFTIDIVFDEILNDFEIVRHEGFGCFMRVDQ